MIKLFTQIVTDSAQSQKIAATVAASVTGTGAVHSLAWIPDDIGKIATLAGICLSMVLIYVHLLTIKKERLEIKLIERQLKDD